MMEPKQSFFWVVLCSVVCLAVAVGVMACLPAWNGMGDMSAFEAVVYLLEKWISK